MAEVIDFPGGPRKSALDALLPDDFAKVLAALCVLGEPAMAYEISALLGHAGGDIQGSLSPAGVEALLAQAAAASEAEGRSLFRRVKLGDQEAWGLTPSCRAMMRELGISPRLRGKTGGDRA